MAGAILQGRSGAGAAWGRVRTSAEEQWLVADRLIPGGPIVVEHHQQFISAIFSPSRLSSPARRNGCPFRALVSVASKPAKCRGWGEGALCRAEAPAVRTVYVGPCAPYHRRRRFSDWH